MEKLLQELSKDEKKKLVKQIQENLKNKKEESSSSSSEDEKEEEAKKLAVADELPLKRRVALSGSSGSSSSTNQSQRNSKEDQELKVSSKEGALSLLSAPSDIMKKVSMSLYPQVTQLVEAVSHKATPEKRACIKKVQIALLHKQGNHAEKKSNNNSLYLDPSTQAGDEENTRPSSARGTTEMTAEQKEAKANEVTKKQFSSFISVMHE